MAPQIRRSLPLVALAVGAGALFAGCGGPAAETGTYWILDDGGGAELCEQIMESYPPQCHGTPVVDWDWTAVDHDEASGVRWGLYAVTVEPDGDRVRLTLADPTESDPR